MILRGLGHGTAAPTCRTKLLRGLNRVILRDRKFADSSLEGDGFEPLVPLTLNPTNAGERDEKKRSSSC